MAKKRCIGGGGHDLFRKGISHKKIPLSFGVAKNSGSAPLNSWESPMNSLDLEFLATGSEPYRYPLASGPEGVTLEGRKMAMAGTAGAVNERASMPTLLNDTNPFERNIDRFPKDFMFELTEDENRALRCQFGTSSCWKRRGRKGSEYGRKTELGSCGADRKINFADSRPSGSTKIMKFLSLLVKGSRRGFCSIL